MLKFLAICLLFATSAFAQSVDLNTLPPDFGFVSQSPDSRTSIRYIRRDGPRFLFEESVVYSDGFAETVKVWVNAESQTTAWGVNGTETSFAPHDCAPANGICFYKWTNADGVFEMKSDTHMFGDIWISDTYFKDGDSWIFWVRNCTTYDEFGFWVDFVRIFNDDTSDEGARVRPEPNRLDELWRVCKPPLLTS